MNSKRLFPCEIHVGTVRTSLRSSRASSRRGLASGQSKGQSDSTRCVRLLLASIPKGKDQKLTFTRVCKRRAALSNSAPLFSGRYGMLQGSYVETEMAVSIFKPNIGIHRPLYYSGPMDA